MNPETLFSITNGIALVGWLLLVIAPGWKWTSKLVSSGLIPLLLGAIYLVLIILFFGRSEGGFGSLAEVGKLFRNEWAVLTGWVHYLAFDLFIGNWELRDSQRLGISHIWVVPCLFFTFMLGPIGLLAYYAISYRARSRA